MTDPARPPRRRPRAIPWLSQFALDHLLLLPLGAAVALAWVNTQPESYYSFTFRIAFAVNHVAMVFFFALVTKEVVEATAPGGELHSWRRTLVPVAAAFGASAVCALAYVRAVNMLEEPMLTIAWPAALPADIAISYLVARVVFRAHAAIPFVLLLAIVCDVLGFVAMALFDPARDVNIAAAGVTVAVAMAIAWALRRARVRSFWPYIAIAGAISWYGLFRSGLQPAVALVPIVPFLPHAARDPGFLVDAQPNARDALSRFELWIRYPAHLTLFFFGLVNAGVPLRALEPGTWGLVIAVLLGKPIGIVLATGAAVGIGLRLPPHLRWRELVVVGLAAAVNFSVGLFVTTALLPAGQLRVETSMAVLLTLAAAPAALLAARLLRVGRFAR